MKNRSELRDIIIKVLYQVYILENTQPSTNMFIGTYKLNKNLQPIDLK